MNKVELITGTRKGIEKYLVEYYVSKGFQVIGCSRSDIDYNLKNYTHHCLDVSDEKKLNYCSKTLEKSMAV